MRFLAVALVLAALLVGVTSASYLVQLKYDNGKVTQEKVYEIDAAASALSGGDFNVTVGNFQTSFAYPIMMKDYDVAYSENMSNPPETMVIPTTFETFVVVPDVQAGANVAVKNGTAVLLNEPIKKAVEIEPKPTSNATSGAKVTPNATQTGKTGNQTGNETGSKPGGLCLITYAVPALGAAAWYGRRKEQS